MKTFLEQYKNLFLGCIRKELNDAGAEAPVIHQKLDRPTPEEIQSLIDSNEEVTEEMKAKFIDFVEDMVKKGNNNSSLDFEDVRFMSPDEQKALNSIFRYLKFTSDKLIIEENLTDGITEETSLNLEFLKNLINSSTEVKRESTIVRDSFREEISLSSIDTSLFTRTLKEGVSLGLDVAELNTFLILKTGMYEEGDFKDLEFFDSKTHTMLWNYQKSLGYRNPDGVLTISPTNEYKTLIGIKQDVQKAKKASEVKPAIEDSSLRHSNLGSVKAQLETTKASVTDLEQKLAITAILNNDLEKYLFRENAGYSIEALIRKVAGRDKYSEIMKENQGLRNLLEKQGNKRKLGDAVIFLLPPNAPKARVKTVLSNVLKALPWLFGIYLGDIPLSFMKKMVPGVDIDKSLAFKNWIGGGMTGEFKDYYNDNKTEITVLENQYTLRGLATTLQLDDQQEADLLAGKINELTEATKQLLQTYISARLIPDLRVMHDESYSVFERGRWFNPLSLFGLLGDIKERKSKELIKQILDTNNTSENDLELSKQVIELIRQEGDVDEKIISRTENRNDYMGEALDQNEVQEHLSWLAKQGADYYNFAILFFTKEVGGISQFGVAQEDRVNLEKAYDFIIARDKDSLDQLLASNSNLQQIVKSIGTEQQENYLLSQIEKKEGLRYTSVGPAKHGPSLIDDDRNSLPNDKAYELATTTTPEEGSMISSLDYAYKSLVQKGEIYGITNAEYHEAFKNKTEVEIDKLTKETVINTGREEHQKTLTTFAELAEKRGDRFVYKLAPVTKEYTYYADGKEITQEVTYNLYMRPDCENPIIVPSSVETVINTSEIPTFDTATMTSVAGKIPAILPWFLIAGGLGVGGGGGGGSAISRPGIEDIVRSIPETGPAI